MGNAMFVGTEDGWVYRSTDDCDTYDFSHQFLQNSLPVPVTDMVAWAPSSDYVVVSTKGLGIFRSTDGLQTIPSSWSGLSTQVHGPFSFTLPPEDPRAPRRGRIPGGRPRSRA